MNSLVIFMCLSTMEILLERSPLKVYIYMPKTNLLCALGNVTTIAGKRTAGFQDGQSAMFRSPRSLCYSQFHDCLFVCDYSNQRIRIIDVKTGIVVMLNLFLNVF